jgi:hypothetical protein
MHGMSATLWKISDSEYTYIYIVYILYTCFVVVAVVVRVDTINIEMNVLHIIYGIDVMSFICLVC